MTCRILLSPAGAGKTQYVLDRAREAARSLEATPWVLLPSAPQMAALRQRLARGAGALNVQVATFDTLYRALLNAASMCSETAPSVMHLPQVVRHRFLMAVLDELIDADRIPYYAGICHRPGFVEAISRLIRELGQGMITGDAMRVAFSHHPEVSARQLELATIASAYREALTRLGYADAEQLGWHALTALQEHPRLASNWGEVYVDGFDSLNTIQRHTLALLADRVSLLTITLTGTPKGHRREMAHTRFIRALDRLVDELDACVKALDAAACGMHPVLCCLERSLWERDATPFESEGRIELLEAPSRAFEAREALRWCKQRIVHDGLAPGQVAILARSIEPYRPLLAGVAEEYGLPVHFALGLPLQDNALVTALLDLMDAFVPASGGEGPALPRRLVVEAWRCPYLNWKSAFGIEEDEESPGTPRAIEPGDAVVLDSLARQGLVIGGLDQWQEVLEPASKRAMAQLETNDDEDHPRPTIDLERASTIWKKFETFVETLTPPRSGTRSEYVAWLETLIGGDSPADIPTSSRPPSLGIVARLRETGKEAAHDLAALRALKEVLRGLVWAERLTGEEAGTYRYTDFRDELVAMVSAAAYAPGELVDDQAVLIADIARARGLSMQAVALLGLAETEFPAILHEDPLLWDSDRTWLRDRGLNIDPLLESDEQGYFYEAVTRAREHLLICRPTLSDNGAPWPPSPYWEELTRLMPHAARHPANTSAAVEPASYEELYERRARTGDSGDTAWDASIENEWQTIRAGANVMRIRTGQDSAQEHDGSLEQWARLWASHYGSEYVWSASRLESYANCPFMLFVNSILRLQPRVEPTVGFDVGQRGTIMHEILEEVYRRAGDPRSLDDLLALLPDTAARILAAAPTKQGFRPTAYWQVTCQETIEQLERNIVALCESAILGDWRPSRFEGRFGLPDRVTNQELAPLVIPRGDDAIRLRGVIDRIDIDSAGRLRVIDYKSSSKSPRYSKRALEEGKVLQLPIYALAASWTLGLGEIAEGFYWHLGSHEASGLQLGSAGVESVLAQAIDACWRAIDGIRGGQFTPRSPSGGCPSWCPAVGFCWQYNESSQRARR